MKQKQGLNEVYAWNPEAHLSTRLRTMPPSGIRKFFDLVANMKDAISLGVENPTSSPRGT